MHLPLHSMQSLATRNSQTQTKSGCRSIFPATHPSISKETSFFYRKNFLFFFFQHTQFWCAWLHTDCTMHKSRWNSYARTSPAITFSLVIHACISSIVVSFFFFFILCVHFFFFFFPTPLWDFDIWKTLLLGRIYLSAHKIIIYRFDSLIGRCDRSTDCTSHISHIIKFYQFIISTSMNFASFYTPRRFPVCIVVRYGNEYRP